MFIAHMPAGYLLTCGILKAKSVVPNSASYRSAMIAGLLGSTVPDMDMLRFYLLDDRQFHHHTYFTHKPLFWVGLWIILSVGFMRMKGAIPLWVPVFAAACLLHLALDSVVGHIYWLWPFNNLSVTLVEVPATHSHWVLSFLTHWTFLLEVIICLSAALLFRKRNNL